MVITNGNFLLDVEPAERLYFFGPFNQESKRELKITNNNASNFHVAFKVKCTDNKVVRIDSCPAGLLKYKETAVVKFSTGPFSEWPDMQNMYIMNIAALETAKDAREAWYLHKGPETGKVQMDITFGDEQ